MIEILGWIVAACLIGFMIGIGVAASIETNNRKQLTAYQKKYGLLDESEWKKCDF